MSQNCNVCGRGLADPIYESPDNRSITTMNKLIDGKTMVYFCERCGHLQTNELPNLAEYYAHEYEINLSSEDDDQLYKVVDGRPVYRADHQATVLQSKIHLFPGCRVLDYGCAKAPTLRKVVLNNPDIEPYLFDVTDKYVPFWQAYPKPAKYATFIPASEWQGNLDVVLSFYALEHVADLDEAIGNVKSLLKPGGVFYFIVPNVYTNIADFIVADHINHFSESSLKWMLMKEGFCDIEVDDVVHESAFVVTARLAGSATPVEADEASIRTCRQASQQMGEYWQALLGRIRQFEQEEVRNQPVAIYGAGFYGNLIASSLGRFEQVSCFVDQNRFLHGTRLNGKPVVAPEELPEQVRHVLVGLNPRIAKENIESIEVWKDRPLHYFYL